MRFTWTAGIMVMSLLCPRVGAAQELRKDSVSNGVVLGGATGAAFGLLVGVVNEEVCSPVDCMVLAAVVGSAVGLAVDRRMGSARPVEPGVTVDDAAWNGALAGSGIATGIVLLDFVEVCRSSRGCTSEGVRRAVIRGAIFGAIVGALVDAAIPSTSGGHRSGERAATPGRRLSLTWGLRF